MARTTKRFLELRSQYDAHDNTEYDDDALVSLISQLAAYLIAGNYN